MIEKREILAVAELLSQVKKVSVLTGAGISAESGVPTFRGKDGLWKQFRAEDLATPEAFYRDPALVWEWYNWRRGLMVKVEPNPAHFVLAQWENIFPQFSVITQNIDGLHQKAGSKNVIELHGNIWKFRCTKEGRVEDNQEFPLSQVPPHCSSCGALLRPHVVWFGEALPSDALDRAFALSSSCEVMLVVGTSAYVQPAASLPFLAAESGARVIEINPEVTTLSYSADFSLRGKAGEILPLLDEELRLKLSSLSS